MVRIERRERGKRNIRSNEMQRSAVNITKKSELLQEK